MGIKTPTRRLASIADAAAYIGCHHMTVRRLISAGGLTGYRVGSRMLRVDLDELDTYLNSRHTGGAE